MVVIVKEFLMFSKIGVIFVLAVIFEFLATDKEFSDEILVLDSIFCTFCD